MSSMTELSALGIQTYELDVTDENAIHHLKDVLEDVLDGTLDILVNNAYVLSCIYIYTTYIQTSQWYL